MSNRIVQHRFRGPEVLEFVTVEPPTSGDLAEDEVLVGSRSPGSTRSMS